MSWEISHSLQQETNIMSIIDDDDIDDETKSSNSMYIMSERMRIPIYYVAIELELETPRLSLYYFSLYDEFLLSDARLRIRNIGFGSTRAANVYI